MLRLLLAVLVTMQPMLLAECAAMAAAPAPCASPCGDQHSSPPTEKSPCCKLGPQKVDPQAVKTATVEVRTNDGPVAVTVAQDSVIAPPARPATQLNTDPTDLLHKRPLSEVLCVLLV